MKQHKWYKELVAWASGIQIQERFIPDDDIWIDLQETDEPLWNSSDYEYRIKPQPKEPQYLYVYKHFKSEMLDFSLANENDSSNVENGQMIYIGKIRLETEDE